MSVLTYADEQAAIMGRIKANWAGTDVAYPNTGYEPDPDTAYIEPRVVRGEAFNASVSAVSRQTRHPGVLFVQVRTPLNQGDQQAMDLAANIEDLFRNVTFDRITFRVPTVRDFGRERVYYRAEVACPYHRDSIHDD
jgi:hypothetical protein